ncbi:MAG: chemotaxis protein CheX, partial [Dehalococcoidia bacterium]|nr:chemotaxis protein CheX [Dehalococcoidia bacterium]
PVSLLRSAYTNQDVTVLVGVTGDVRGVVLYCLSAQTACKFAEQMLGQQVPEFDDLAQSGIAELGNVITGAAGVHLAEAGFTFNITPPTLLIGNGTMVSTVDLPRLVIPVKTEHGPLEIHVALQR